MKKPTISDGHSVEIPTIVEPWMAYETYMWAAPLTQLLAGKPAELLIKFPAEVAEDNRLHIHPISDRVITILEGSGQFEYFSPEHGVEKIHLIPGMRVEMARGVLHTFRASWLGMLVHSMHLPWVPFEDPKCLVYPAQMLDSSILDERTVAV